MCKNFFVSHIENADRAFELVRKATPLLTANNKDGFGYVAVNAQGNAWCERWLDVTKAWVMRGSAEAPHGLTELLGGAPYYNAWGRPRALKGDAAPKLIMAHSRMSTSNVTLNNVHPFALTRNDDSGVTALVHNGVVREYGAHKLDTSGSDGCDSMGILNAYLTEGADSDPQAFRKVAERFSGWYACGVVNTRRGANPTFDVFRYMASLHCVAVKGIGLVWTTDPSDAQAAAKAIKAKVVSQWECKPGVFARIDITTGETLAQFKFEGKSQTTGWNGSSYGGATAWRRPSTPAVSRKTYVSRKIDAIVGKVDMVDTTAVLDLVQSESARKHAKKVAKEEQDRLDFEADLKGAIMGETPDKELQLLERYAEIAQEWYMSDAVSQAMAEAHLDMSGAISLLGKTEGFSDNAIAVIEYEYLLLHAQEESTADVVESDDVGHIMALRGEMQS